MKTHWIIKSDSGESEFERFEDAISVAAALALEGKAVTINRVTTSVVVVSPAKEASLG